MIVVIPAYEPDEKLIRLLETFHEAGTAMHVLIVDDGSGPAHRPILDRALALGCTVIGHTPNRGKGFALKRGFRFAEQHFPGHDVVCADCDGQHRVLDILRVAGEVARRRTIVLGSRRFTGAVPLTSRVGNTATRVLFARATGRRVFDTQTGLRGYPAALLPWLQTIDGDRFEYELNVLLQATEADMSIHETPIETIYLEGNASSHFRPLVDSARVYAPLVKFCASSLSAFAVDVAALLGLMAATDDLLVSVVGARVLSAAWNFTLNRRVVFRARHGRSTTACAARYGGLVAAVLAANYALLATLHDGLGIALVPAKLLTEAVLFAASYQAQKRFVFGAAAPAEPLDAPVRAGDPAPTQAPLPAR